MMEHSYAVLRMPGMHFNNIANIKFFDGTDIGIDLEKTGYIKLCPSASFYKHLLPIFNDEHHWYAKDDDDNCGMFIDTEDRPGIIGIFLWYCVIDQLLNIYDEDYIKGIRSEEIALCRRNGFSEILLYDKTETKVLSNNPYDICEHIKSIASGEFGFQLNDQYPCNPYNWPANEIRLILFDILDSDGNVAKTIPYFCNETVTDTPIESIFKKLQKMVRIFEPDDLELNCLVNCKYTYTSTYIMIDKELAKDNKFLYERIKL